MGILENYKERPTFEKTIINIRIVYSVVFTALIILSLFDYVKWVDTYLPLLFSPIMIMDAIVEWKRNRKSAYASLAVALLGVVAFVGKCMKLH